MVLPTNSAARLFVHKNIIAGIVQIWKNETELVKLVIGKLENYPTSCWSHYCRYIFQILYTSVIQHMLHTYL